MSDAGTTILAHFHGLAKMSALGGADGQGLPCFSVERASAALAADGDYVCSGNLYWLLLAFDAQPGVPRYIASIVALQEHLFVTPSPMHDAIFKME